MILKCTEISTACDPYWKENLIPTSQQQL